MQKHSRTRAVDPAQEKLRQSKDSWNSQTSKFISELIDFKKGINGREVSGKNIARTSIKEPFPDEMSAFLSELSNNALKVIEQAQAIISEQENYSLIKNKKKSSLKEEEIIKMSQFLSEAAIFGQSWAGSRLWSKIKMILSDEKKFSTDILDGCKELYDSLKKLEDSCLAATEDKGAPEVFTNIQSCLHIFNNRVLSNILSIQKYQLLAKKNVDQLDDLQDDLESENLESENLKSTINDIILNKKPRKTSFSELVLQQEHMFKMTYQEIYDYNDLCRDLFIKLYPQYISQVETEFKSLNAAFKNSEELYEKIEKYNEDPSGIIFSKDDVDIIYNLIIKYNKLINFYKNKIIPKAEHSKLPTENLLRFFTFKLQEKEDNLSEDLNELITVQAAGVNDLKNFLRKQWLNLKLDLKSSSSTEKYNKDILNASREIRKFLNKLMVLIEEESVNINLSNIKKMFLAEGLPSNFPTAQVVSYTSSIYSILYDIANISMIYADLYKKIIRREESKGSRYYRDISTSDLKETKNLLAQMSTLMSSVNNE